MRVSEAVVDRLRAGGVDVVFGIPGTQTLPLNEAIERAGGLRFVMARHETAVSHQAWGYAETSDGLAATLVVPGPGDMNAMNGLKNARNDTVPLVHVAVETEPALRGGDAIHETPPDTYDNAVKENVTVASAAGAPAAVGRAVAVARTPPQGPVRVGVPRDFLGATVGTVAADETPGTPGDVPAAALDEAAALLGEADAPLVLAGGGVRRAGASEGLAAVAGALDAPVATTLKGKGTFPEDRARAAGVASTWEPAVRSLVADSDAALAVGTDLDAVTTGNWELPLPDRLVHVTLDPDDLGRGYDPAVAVVGDAGRVLDGLVDRLADGTGGAAGDRDGAAAAARVRRARESRIATLRDREGRMTSPDVLAAAREAIPRDAVVTADGGGLRIWMNPAFPAAGPERFVQPGSWATMGTALPSAIGAAVADGDREAVAIVGDGGLMMSVHELHTVVAENLPVTTLVTNNDGFAIISEAAEREFGADPGTYDWDGTPVDFTGTARSMGMRAKRVETPGGVRDALSTALEADEPMLVEALTAPHEPQALDWFADE